MICKKLGLSIGVAIACRVRIDWALANRCFDQLLKKLIH